MKKELVAVSLILLPCVTTPAEVTVPIAGHYNAETDNDLAVELAILGDGSARHTLTVWDGGEIGVFEVRDASAGRWTAKGTFVTLTFARYGATNTIEYEASPCLRKDRQGVCSPGLRLVTSTLPGIYAWNLFKYEPRKL